MIYLFDTYERVLDASTTGSQEDSKRIAELSMALHYVQKFYPPDAYSDVHVQKLQSSILDYIHCEGYLKLLGNYFLLQQHITPYVFIRSEKTISRYFEGLLKIFQQFDLSVQESFPYRSLERNHLLYKIGSHPISVSFESKIVADALQIQSFNRDLSYAFTHTVFYSTDFSDLQIVNQKIKDCSKILIAQSFNANDIDLFLESCICLLSQDISKDEFEDMIALIHDIELRNVLLFECGNIAEDYHPLFVHDILRGLIQRRFDCDINCPVNSQKNKGPIRSLWEISIALKGKDPTRILEIYSEYAELWGRMSFLEKIIDHKINMLNAFACQEVLFEREFSHLGQYSYELYSEYQEQLEVSLKRHSFKNYFLNELKNDAKDR